MVNLVKLPNFSFRCVTIVMSAALLPAGSQLPVSMPDGRPVSTIVPEWRRHAARQIGGAAGAGPSRRLRRGGAARRPRRLCRARTAGGCGRAHARRAVLHLAPRHVGHLAVRGGARGPPIAACGCGFCWTTTTPAAWIACWPPWMPIPTSRCGCSIRSGCGAGARSAISPTSRGSIGACTTSRSPPTIRSPSLAAATSAMNTSTPGRMCCSSISMCWPSGR